MKAVIIILGMTISYLIVCALSRKGSKKRRFSDRKMMMLEEIYETHYKNRNIEFFLFKELWLEIANTLHVPSEQLLPTDSFHEELKCANALDYDNDDLFYNGISRIIKMRPGDSKSYESKLCAIKTIDDYIMFFNDLRMLDGK